MIKTKQSNRNAPRIHLNFSLFWFDQFMTAAFFKRFDVVAATFANPCPAVVRHLGILLSSTKTAI